MLESRIVSAWIRSALMIGCLMSAPSAVADETARPAAVRLQQLLDELDHVDQQLREAIQQRADVATWRDRRALNRRITQLQDTQARLLRDIEQLVGPQPTTVQPDTPLPLEEDLKALQRRHDALQDNDAVR